MFSQPSLQRTLLSSIILSTLNLSPAHSQQTNLLTNITVTASTISDRFETDQHESSSTTRMDGDEIHQQKATNIIEVLRTIPGVTADLQGEGDGIKIKFRGIENQRYMGEKPGIAIVIDGVPVFERTGKVNIDLDNIESIRVIKGGASYLYGEDALAGAVIITTKRGSLHEGVTLEQDVGAFGYQRTYLKTGFSNDQFGGHLQYAKRQSDGYYALSSRETETLAGNLQWFIDERSDLTFGFEKSERFRDREGSVTGVTQAQDDPKGEQAGRGYTRQFNVDLARYNLTYNLDFSDSGNLQAIVYQYQDITDFWSAPIRFDANGQRVGDDQVERYQYLNDYEQVQRGVKLEVRDTFGHWGIMGGLELKRNTFDEITQAKEDYKLSPSPRSQVITQGTNLTQTYREETTRALYSEAKTAINPDTHLTFNYRFDQIQLSGEDRLTQTEQDETFNIHSWRVGANHELNPKQIIYGGISTGFRAPALSELSGNPNLEPEHSYNYEIGLRSQARVLSWNLHMNSSIFYIERNDFITSTSGQYVHENAPNETYHDNIGNVTSRGLEFALETDVQHQLAFGLAYSYIDSEYQRYDDFYLALGNARGTPVDSLAELTNPSNQVFFQHHDNSGNQVPRTPRHQLNVRTHWQPNPNWRFTTEVDYRGESYADEINQEKLPARALVNMMLNYQTRLKLFGGRSQQFNAFVKVDNLLDDSFFSTARGHADSNMDGNYDAEDLSIVVDPGQVWQAGIGIKF
jgi:iron complex outermembrane receptor protein